MHNLINFVNNINIILDNSPMNPYQGLLSDEISISHNVIHVSVQILFNKQTFSTFRYKIQLQYFCSTTMEALSIIIIKNELLKMTAFNIRVCYCALSSDLNWVTPK